MRFEVEFVNLVKWIGLDRIGLDWARLGIGNWEFGIGNFQRGRGGVVERINHWGLDYYYLT